MAKYLLDTNAISLLMRADPAIEAWLAGLTSEDRLVICPITRGEVLFGIARLPQGNRRTELEHMATRFLEAFECEAIPERAGDFYATIKLARQRRGLTLDENDLWVAATAMSMGATLVSEDRDFGGIADLFVLAPSRNTP